VGRDVDLETTVASGEAAIRVAEVMQSLFKWLKSIVIQYLDNRKLHVAVGVVEQKALTKRSRRHEEERNADSRKGPTSSDDAKEIEGDNSRKIVTHPLSQEVLLTHQSEPDGGW